MTGTTISGVHLASVTLISGTTPNPVTVAGGATISTSGTGLVGEVGTYWTVFNHGTVEGSGGTGTGIYFASSHASGGSIFNESGGTISGTSHGINLGAGTYAGVGTISNDGTILGGSTGSHPAAIYLPGGGYVTNLSGGVISSASTGILGYAASSDTVANQGKITATGNGVLIDTGGSVTNQSGGLIQAGSNGIELLVAAGSTYTGSVANLSGGTIIAGTYGIYVQGGTAVNQGFVTSSGDGMRLAGGSTGTNETGGTILASGGDGVQLYGGGSFTNQSGAIINGGNGILANQGAGTVVNQGGVTGAIDGIFLATGGAVTILSGGVVTAAVGIQIYGAGAVTNLSGGTILASDNGVVLNQGTALTVFNQGAISAAHDGVVLSEGGSATNAAGGTISGTSAGVFATGGASTLLDAGTIEGSGTAGSAVTLAPGYANRLVVDPGAVFVGTVSGGNTVGATAISGAAVVSTLELASGATAGTLSGLATQYIDFARVTVDAGASWTLGGSSTLQAGYALTNSGSLTVAGTLQDNGLLTNSAGIGGMVLLSGGTVVNALGATIAGLPAAVYGATGGSAGTVFNAGLLESSSDPSRSAGVALLAGGLVSNASTGTIQGGGGGVIIYNPADTFSNQGTVLNDGSIGGIGTHANGVELDSGGFISNASDGTITGSNHGAEIDVASAGQTALVVNQGLISGASTGNTGIYLQGGGTVSNTGTVLGGQQGVFFGDSGSANGTLVNSGSVGAEGAGVAFFRYGLLTNAGVITSLATAASSGTATVGVELTAGGSISNGASGATTAVIQGYQQGVLSTGTYTALVSNFGTIEATSDVAGGYGISIQGAGSVSNAGTAALISGNGGIAIGLAGTVSNTGTILTLPDGYSGVTIGGAGLVTNLGKTALIQGWGGVSIDGAGTVLNSGTINAAASGGEYSGVDLLGGGLVSNAATGLIEGYRGGISILGTGTVLNAGTVAVTGTFVLAEGVAVSGAGLVDNTGTASLIEGEEGVAVGAGGTVINAGIIEATATSAPGIGVALDAGGSVTNHSGATISGYTGIYGGVSGAATVINTGIVSGGTYAVRFAAGYADRLVVDPGAVFNGTVSGGNTLGATASSGAPVASTLELASGATAGTLSGLGTKYIDFVQITIDSGATWTLSSVPAGYTITDLGTLVDTGTIAGALSLGAGVYFHNASGARIVGSGKFAIAGGAGATVVNAGVIDPANYGVYLPDGGTVTNVSGGTIVGTAAGVKISGAAGTVVNAGSIYATGAGSTGVALNSGGSVTNQSGGTIDGALYGIDSSNAATVTNSGRIGVTADIAIGLSAGAVTNAATGTIDGTGSGIRIYGGGTVVDAGTISGGSYSVYFHSGFTNRLVVDPGAVFGGTVDGGNTIGATAVSTLELASGASKGFLTGLGSQYVNFGQVTLDAGATWVLDGANTLAAGTTLTAGTTLAGSSTLVVNGSLLENGLATVNNGVLTVGGTAGANGMLTVGAGGTIDLTGEASTSNDLIAGNAASGSGTIVVSGTGALVDSLAVIAVGVSAGATGLLVVSNGGSVFAETGNSNTDPAVSLADRGAGTIVVTGPGSELTADGVVYDGRAAGSSGTLLIENQGSMVLAADPLGDAAELQIGVGNASNASLAGGSGSATVTSGGVLNSGSLIFIGGDGDLPGTLSVTSGTVAGTSTVLGGTVMAARIELGVNTGSTGGGTGVLNVGTGALVETLGTATTQFTVEIGQAVASSGTATIAGTLTANGQIVIGNTGSEVTNGTTLAGATGLLTVNTGGTVSGDDGLYIGNNAGAVGTVVVDGGTITAAPSGTGFVAFGVGSAGSGTLIVEGGGTVTATQSSGPAFDVAIGTGSQGTATVTGANSLLQVNGQLNVGDGGSGWLDVNSGAVVNAGTSSVTIGTRSGGAGTISVESSGTLIGGALSIPNPGSSTATGTLAVGAGGTVEVSSVTEGAGGAITVTGGLLTSNGSTGAIFIGDTGTGATLTIGTGGTVSETGTLNAPGVPPSPGILDNVSIGSGNGGTAASSGTVVIDGGTLSAALGLLVGNGTLTVDGDGSGVVSGTSAGGLQIGGFGGSGTVVVGSGGTVDGFGSFDIANGLMSVTAGGLVTISSTGTNSFSGIGNSSPGSPAGSGTLIVNGGTVSETSAGFSIGGSNTTGSLLVEGGGLLTTTTIASQFAQISIDGSGTGAAVASVDGGTWDVNGPLAIASGPDNTGSLDVRGNGVVSGVVNAGTNAISVATQSGTTGTITVESGGTLLGGGLSLSNTFSGTATGLLAVGGGGTVEVASVQEGAGGTITVGEGTLDALLSSSGVVYIGQSGSGAVLSIGSLGVVSGIGTNALQIGGLGGASGTVTVGGGGTLDAFAGIDVNNGLMSVAAGGQVTIASPGTLAFSSVGNGNAGNSGTLIVNGGTVAETGPFFAIGGTNTSGSLLVEGGGLLTTTSTGFGPAGEINASGTGAAAATVSDGTWDLNGALNVGDSGTGSLEINSSGVVNAGTNAVDIGNQSGSNGTVAVGGVSGSGTLIGGALSIAAPGSGGAAGTLTVSSGSTVEVTSVNEGGGGIITVSGDADAVLTSSGQISIGGSASGALLTIGDGVVNAGTSAINVADQSGTSGTVTVGSGGTLIGGALSISDAQSGSAGTLAVASGGTVEVASLSEAAGGTIGVSGGLLSVAGNATIGQSSSGAVLTLQSGTVDVGSLSVGVGGGSPGGGGSVTVSGGVLDSSGLVQIGNGGTGFVTIDTGGSLIAGDGVAFQGAGSSELLVNGGSASVTGGITVQDGLVEVTGGGVLTGDSATQASNVGGGGPGNSGTLIVDGGTVSDTAAFFTVGGGGGASGTLIVDGGGLLTTTSDGNTAGQIDGGSGDAIASVNDGTWDVNGFLIVGNNTGDTGTLDINNGLVNAGTNAITIANLSTSSGTVTVGSGGTLLGGGLTMADQSGSSGTLTVSSGATVDLASIADGGGAIDVSGGLLSVSGLTTIGQGPGAGGATLSETSGTVDTAGLYIGNGTGATGTVTVSGGTLDSTEQVQIGNQGDGLLTVDSGGSVTASAGLQVDSFGTGNGTVIVDGGAMTDSNGFSIGNGGSTGVAGVTVEAGGVLSVTGTNQFDIGSGGGTAEVVVSGGTFTASGSPLEISDSGGSASLLVENAGTVVTTYSGQGPSADINGTSGGQASVTVSGAGSVWDINGASGDQLAVGDSGTGTLTVSDGGLVNNGTNTIVIGNQSSGSGYVDVNGGGALLEGSSVSVGSGTSAGTLEIDTGGTVDVGSASVGQDGSLILGGGLLDPIALTLNAGGMISGFGTLEANLGNASTLTASGGALDVTGTISGSGTMAIAASATLMLPGTVLPGQIIDFTANTGELQIGTISFGGTIGLDGQGDIQPGDTIVVTGVSDATAANVVGGNTLQIVSASLGDIDLQLDPEQGFLGDYFHVATSGGNAVVTESNVPCYLEGTRILTGRGEVKVEKLRIGDHVVTLDGSEKPIKWIGRRSYSGAIPTGQRDVIPILIKRGALGPKLPKRDLIVSPLHAMYCDGVLVPAEHLVNGVTVLRAPDIDPIRYFHIELDQHNVIYADGAPAETFVDCDSRPMFHNAAEFDSLYPGDATPRWRYCAPRLEGGERLDAIKRAIDRRAGIELPEPGAPPGRLEGRLDGVEGGRISGWAFHPDRPVEPVWLEVLDGDGVIARVHARRYRADLEAAGVGDGRHGFELNLTGQMRTRRELRVRRVEDGVELEGSPLVVEARGGEALLEDARRVIAAAILDPSDEAALDALAAELLHGVDALRRAREGIPRPLAGGVRGGWNGGHDSPSPNLSRKRERNYRALIIDAQLPRPEHDAGSQAILGHAAALTALGFQVEFVAAHELARAEHASVALEHAGYVVHRAPRIASVEEVLRRHRNAFDVVYLHRLANAEAYAPLARAWQARARLLYCVADLHHVRLARQAAVQASAEVADEARAVRVRELNAMRLCDAVITHSTAEAAYLARVAPGASVHVVAWTPEARPRPMPLAARQGVAAIGSWSHEPNVDAVRWLVSDIMPRVWAAAPRTELLVVGSDWPARVPWISDARVRLVGAVTSIETLLGMLRLTVAPLRFGAGLKGKVLDSFACEVPCVMTPVAAEGFPLEGSLPGLVGEDAAALASLIVRLHEESPLHRAAAGDGLLLAAKFSPEAVRAAMAAAIGLRMEETRVEAALGVGG